MSRILTLSVLALTAVAGLTGAASAQSYTAPAGIPAVTAPGGVAGAPANDRHRLDGAVPAWVVGADVATTGSLRAPHPAIRSRTAR
ncbi:hypothetical protein [Methylobacterium sp. Leaf100]|uniref:hypothetical protein n=1 Tax=Methylobacterium sp. Leaf100 TaxID=1736252 RepID=UPI0006F22DAD|nr:hypothetical protein [Methylobacterium sp. Leaf100]KQP34958.1 hypothetical protein ASF25_15125 [Methylobacterium sp. Leaf100]